MSLTWSLQKKLDFKPMMWQQSPQPMIPPQSISGLSQHIIREITSRQSIQSHGQGDHVIDHSSGQFWVKELREMFYQDKHNAGLEGQSRT